MHRGGRGRVLRVVPIFAVEVVRHLGDRSRTVGIRREEVAHLRRVVGIDVARRARARTLRLCKRARSKSNGGKEDEGSLHSINLLSLSCGANAEQRVCPVTANEES